MKVGTYVVIGDLLHAHRGQTGWIVAKAGPLARFRYTVRLDSGEIVRCTTPRKVATVGAR